MLLGAHVSAAGGLDKAIARGEELGSEAIQTFASSPRSMKYTYPEKDVLDRYRRALEKSSVTFHVFHGVYLINLAHADQDYVEVCADSLKFYQRLAEDIGGFGTVFHVGSHKGAGLPAVLDQLAEGIAHVLEESPPRWLLIENTAGQAGTIGQSVEELGIIFEAVAKRTQQTDQLGICIDTQHAFASGYDLRKSAELERMITEVERFIGLERLKMIHLNDSLTDWGSYRDRHANIGEGLIGEEALAQVVCHSKFKSLPFILEVPGEKKSGPRKADIDLVKDMINDGLYQP
jgi:deoxyribonuclease IV